MNGEESYPETTRSLDSLREMRLLVLLGDMVEEQGKVEAAETLGVNFRTLDRALDTGSLTGRMAHALETHLLQGGGSAADRQRRQAQDLAERVGGLEEKLRDGLAAVRREAQAAGDAQVEMERRLAALEAAEGGQRASPAVGKPAWSGRPPGGTPGASGTGQVKPGAAGPAPARPPRRDYPELVTAEPEPGEELVYGEAATAVIIRWRGARDEFAAATDKLTKLDAQERRLELEVALIEEHKLTLPPATYPWDWGDRRQEAQRRTLVLGDVIKDRARLKLRRALTLGLWR